MSSVVDPELLRPDERQTAARAANRNDRLFETLIVAIAAATLLVIGAIAVFVLITGWPSFAANGWRWFTNGDIPLDVQLGYAFTGDPEDPSLPYTVLNAWPAILGTILTTAGALLIALPFSIFAAIYIAELSPKWLASLLDPVVGLLAAIPSVIYGLLAILVIAPWIDDYLLPDDVVDQLSPIVTLTGANLLLGIIVLALMIAPLMVAIFADALRAVPTRWKEGGIALGCDRWRMTIRISLGAIRPAIVAGTSLATGRAVGEAIALSMATGSIAFVPNPLDGVFFFLEPVRTLASSIVDYAEGLEMPALEANLFAFGVVLFVSTATLTIGAKLISRSLERRLSGD